MIIWEPFDLWLQDDESLFVANEVLDKVCAGIPDAVRIRIDRREDIEQVLDIYILRRDPS